MKKYVIAASTAHGMYFYFVIAENKLDAYKIQYPNDNIESVADFEYNMADSDVPVGITEVPSNF